MKNRPGSFLAGTAIAAMSILLAACSKAPESVVAPSATASASGNVVDADVTTAVRTALLDSAILKSFDINVVTLKGDVRLVGKVDTQAQIDEAIKVARASAGVHTIHNELTLQK
jgi:osmotically-inducible protein OsmY